MKYLIIGASGFIGSSIYNYCRLNGLEVYGTCYRNNKGNSFIEFDQTHESLSDLFLKININEYKGFVVIMCAANTSLDSCKRDEKESRLLNVLSTERLIDEAAFRGMKPVFLSSEAVFDGRKGLYNESDKPNPITVYGKQKLEVENYIRKLDSYLIFRISRAVSSIPGRRDIFDEFYQAILRDKEIVCLKDQSFNPTDVTDIAKFIVNACEMGLNGLYHISNGDYVTRSELAKKFANRVMCREANIIERDYEEIGFCDNRHIKGGLKSEYLNLMEAKFRSLDEIINSLVEFKSNES